MAASIARALRVSGFEVASAATHAEAIEHIEIGGLRPDVILTDYHLGKGLTSETLVIELIRLLKFKPRTILLTGGNSPYVQGIVAFADRVLFKPVAIADLLHALSESHFQRDLPHPGDDSLK